MKLKIAVFTLAVLICCTVFGQTAEKTAAAGNTPAVKAETLAEETVQPAENGQSITLRQIMSKGGWLMYVIAGLSFVASALAIFYLLTMRKGLLFPKVFILEAQDAAENGDFQRLRELCEENRSPAAKIIRASLEHVIPGQPVDYSRLRDAMEDEGGRQAGFLWQRLQYLMDVAVISPMVGLLGTVWGMMISFAGIESGVDFASKAETMANGIAQAMYTTFGGLIVGIFAMALYDLLRGHLNRLTSSLESACGSVLRRVAPAGLKSYGAQYKSGGR